MDGEGIEGVRRRSRKIGSGKRCAPHGVMCAPRNAYRSRISASHLRVG